MNKLLQVGSKKNDQKNEANLQSDLKGLSSESFSFESICSTNNLFQPEKRHKHQWRTKEESKISLSILTVFAKSYKFIITYSI